MPKDTHGQQQRARTRAMIRAGSPQEVSPVSRPVLPTREPKQLKPPRKSLAQEAKRMLELKAQVAQQSGTADVTGEAGTPLQTELVDMAPSEDFPPTPNIELLKLVKGKVGVVADLCATLKRKNRESNKENIDTASRPKTFIDPQENAHKVLWHGDSQEAFSDSSRDNVASQKRQRIRTRESHAADEDFETATPGVADKRRRDLHNKTGQRKTTAQASSKRSGTEVPGTAPSAGSAADDGNYEPDNEPGVIAINHQAASNVSLSSPLRPSERAPPSAQPPRDPLVSSRNRIGLSVASTPPISTAQELEEVRQAARDRVETYKPRRVQIRSAYSAAEEDRLIELIENYGISYALLKTKDETHPNGPLLGERSQVQLKDKAQELKFQYLK
jgi:hypothetical protein